jgi:cytochrome c oxidase subunit IV
MTHIDATARDEDRQHSGRLFFIVWAWLFALSAFSWLVAYFQISGFPRWSLLLVFMVAKAVLIVAVFMRLAWERLALVVAIAAPLLVLVAFMSALTFEASYIHAERTQYLGDKPSP